MGRRFLPGLYSSHYNFPLKIIHKGSVLLEVLLAVFILSIAMVTIIGNFVQSSALASETGYHLRLSLLLHSKLDYLFTRDVIFEETTQGNFSEPYENCSYHLRIIEEEPRYKHTSFPIDLPGLEPMYRIEIKLFIPVGNRIYEFNTHSYYNHLDFLNQPRNILRFKLHDN